ncbi:VrrA/YqfQ family protein [Neobacillus sp. YX16]|uniref:VrrA/YqfQ family protein n=1 Tax=Neobacillus sp. YX16 TaxID=3047874 RepID=UPI0024C22514|nr:VrrA/YqfQ family protein [Neobacillus sp. YX16]WHZ01764.1 VrrA/YqfQ family protein [Neobacillus sp. YX16]
MQQPRPRYPIYGHMGPNMMGRGPYGGQQRMMNPYGGSGQMIGQTMGRGQGRRNGSGLLSKILGGKKQGNQRAGLGGAQTAGRAASSGGGVGSLLKTLSNPNSLTGFINNTQQVLNSVQSITPMIQQYGPLVKNIPMMWQLYKGFKDLPTEEQSEENTPDTHIMAEESASSPAEPKKRPKKERVVQSERVEEKQPNGPSIPKLYI